METKSYAFHTVITILVLILLGGAFYWFEYRPAEIRKVCVEETTDIARQLFAQKNSLYQEAYEKEKGEDHVEYMEGAVERGFYDHDDFEAKYRECLRRQGLEK